MKKKVNITIGQRWLSEAEPELGLGVVSKVYEGKVDIRFSVSNLTRQYNIIRAPIKRMCFKPGDTLTTKSGESFVVEGMIEKDGLVYYSSGAAQWCETELADTTPINNPADRLGAGDFDSFGTFELRYETLCLREHIQKSVVKGFCGGGIDLIPHQLYIADAVASRHLPRVMLCDQVGLGKTIEALLIIKKLIQSSRVHSVLIIVPEHLILQWFGELYHRFDLTFSIIDSEYCREEQAHDPYFDPFDESQFCICSYAVFKTMPGLQDVALIKPWDMVVIDEVHHVQQASEEYDFFKTLAAQTPGLMLLTAIPEFPNLEDFFARLHLIDPVFYDTYERFFWDVDRYVWIAGLAERLMKNKPLQPDHKKFLGEKIAAGYLDPDILEGDDLKPDTTTRQKILDYLIDQHGMGRILFRNTRKTISGFPKRVVHVEALDRGTDEHLARNLVMEFEFDIHEKDLPPDYDFVDDPRVSWLLSLLKKEGKILLMCMSKNKVLALETALTKKGFTDFLLFHEDIEFMERDQQVASFYETDGPQLLLSSEIGSEGRNFQFCRNLVFFDLPFDPHLIEQRIGRLDRIGQKEPVHIFLPYCKMSPQGILVNWFYEGLNIFKEFYDGHNQAFSLYSRLIKNMALKGNYDPVELDHIINETKKEYTKSRKKNEKGRDILVELNSFDKVRAEEIIDAIRREDDNRDCERNIIGLLEFYGFDQELIDTRTYQLHAEAVKNNIFSQLIPHGQIITFDREVATKRTDYAFITPDHELTHRSIDLFSGQSTGNCTVAAWTNSEKEDLLFEIIYVLECIAPPHYNINRFLPPSPVRILVNKNLEDLTTTFSHELLNDELTKHSPGDYTGLRPLLSRHTEEMLAGSMTLAQNKAEILKRQALDEVEKIIGAELKRLELLKKVNPHMREEEVAMTAGEMESIRSYIPGARLRMDSVRVILRIKQ